MRNLRIRYPFYVLLLCCIAFAGCDLLSSRDQKTGQLCITLADGTVQCRPVDDQRLLVLRGGSDGPALTTWDAGSSLDTARLGKQSPAQALLQVLQQSEADAQIETLDPARTAIRFKDGVAFLTDRKTDKVVKEFVLDARRSMAFSPASSSAGTYDYVVYTEEVCQPMSMLEALLQEAGGMYDVRLEDCGDSLYARMGHVIVAISEFKMIKNDALEAPDTCRDRHLEDGLVPTNDVASTLAALATPPDGGGEGGDAPAILGGFVQSFSLDGLMIYWCDDRLKLVPADADRAPYYLDPRVCCYVLHRNDDLGLLEIWFSNNLPV
jgi:hypothetical protein